MKRLLKLLALGSALLALWGCNENVGETPGAFDPCEAEPENLAEFKVRDYISGDYKNYLVVEPDSLIANIVLVKAQHTAAKYKCSINSDSVIYDNPNVFIDFRKEFASNRYEGWKEIQLIAYGSPNDCYPQGRIDTFSKNYYFWTEKETQLRRQRLIGQYKYQNVENPNDYGNCWIKDSLQPPSYTYDGFYVWGFPGRCEIPLDISIHPEHIRIGTRINDYCRGDGFAKTTGRENGFLLKWFKAVDFDNDSKPIFLESSYLFTKL